MYWSMNSHMDLRHASAFDASQDLQQQQKMANTLLSTSVKRQKEISWFEIGPGFQVPFQMPATYFLPEVERFKGTASILFTTPRSLDQASSTCRRCAHKTIALRHRNDADRSRCR